METERINSHTIPTEKDWEDFIYNKLPIELEYDDLEVEVEDEFGGDPISDGMPGWYPISYSKSYRATGRINSYDLSIEGGEYDSTDYWKGIISKYLDKDVDEISKEDLDSIDENHLYDWLREELREDAESEAERDYYDGNIDVDSVRWNEYDDWRD